MECEREDTTSCYDKHKGGGLDGGERWPRVSCCAAINKNRVIMHIILFTGQ